MKAAMLQSIGDVEVVEVEDPPAPGPSSVVVRISRTTVCGSDLHLMHGALPSQPPYVLGHEYVGTVEATGPGVTAVSVGDRVVGPAAPWCGSCRTCRRGQIQACPNGGVFGSGPTYGGLGGSMAEALTVPHADTVLSKVPDGVSDEQALLVGDVLATGMTASRQALTTWGGVLVVLGCGPVGLSAVHTARLFGAATVIASDPVAKRREVAEALGADHAVDPTSQDLAALVTDVTGGLGADGVVEAVGQAATIAQAVEVAAVGGSIAIVGITPGPVEVPMPQVLFKNLTLWAGLGDLGHADELLALIRDGILDPSPMFTDRGTLTTIPAAIAAMEDPTSGTVKYAITPG